MSHHPESSGGSPIGFLMLFVFGGMFEFINSLGSILGVEKHH
ncbi:MAG: hypothetical protein WCG44_01565 [bacterium]